MRSICCRKQPSTHNKPRTSRAYHPHRRELVARSDTTTRWVACDEHKHQAGACTNRVHQLLAERERKSGRKGLAGTLCRHTTPHHIAQVADIICTVSHVYPPHPAHHPLRRRCQRHQSSPKPPSVPKDPKRTQQQKQPQQQPCRLSTDVASPTTTPTAPTTHTIFEPLDSPSDICRLLGVWTKDEGRGKGGVLALLASDAIRMRAVWRTKCGAV